MVWWTPSDCGTGKEALRLLHILLEEGEVLQIFGMVTRQFRLLIQAREILDSGGSEDGVRSQLSLHPWVAQKVTEQAKQFSLSALDEYLSTFIEDRRGW